MAMRKQNGSAIRSIATIKTIFAVRCKETIPAQIWLATFGVGMDMALMRLVWFFGVNAPAAVFCKCLKSQGCLNLRQPLLFTEIN
jgi:hypothetical protein